MDRLIKVGKIQPKNSLEISKSRIGLGFEKLDRDAFDPEKAYDKVLATGIKWARLQSGWQKTEREKGVYDFSWLDPVVDNMLARGIQPWLCLCYGNDLYTEAAKKFYGAVGCPPIFTEEEKLAWANYVKAVVTRYKGKITHYEVWNEPDGVWCWKHGASGTELGLFTVDTAKAIREIDEDCEIIGGVVCQFEISFLADALEAGMGEWIDAVSFHEYTYDETKVSNKIKAYRGLINQYNPKIKLIQGESGSQSRGDGAGALTGCAGTPRIQAKQLLRHTMVDLLSEVEFTSYFSCMDMKEALNGTVGDETSYKDFGYFGVLGADFDEEGNATGEYTPKDSYYALQNIVTMFSDNCKVCDLPLIHLSEMSPRIGWVQEPSVAEITAGGFVLDDGRMAYVYWKPTDLLTIEYSATTSVELMTDKEEVQLVDLYDGSIYKIPEDMITRVGKKTIRIKNLPLKDYPLAIVF